MAGLERVLALGASILSVDGETLELGSPFLAILGCSNDFSGANELVSCGAALSGLASL